MAAHSIRNWENQTWVAVKASRQREDVNGEMWKYEGVRVTHEPGRFTLYNGYTSNNKWVLWVTLVAENIRLFSPEHIEYTEPL
jgi:hypothetical protein